MLISEFYLTMDIVINMRQPCCYCKLWQISFVCMFSPNKNSFAELSQENRVLKPASQKTLVKISQAILVQTDLFQSSIVLLQEKI